MGGAREGVRLSFLSGMLKNHMKPVVAYLHRLLLPLTHDTRAMATHVTLATGTIVAVCACAMLVGPRGRFSLECNYLMKLVAYLQRLHSVLCDDG